MVKYGSNLISTIKTYTDLNIYTNYIYSFAITRQSTVLGFINKKKYIYLNAIHIFIFHPKQ